VPRYRLHPLDDCFERVRRTGEHLADFKSRVEVMFAEQAHAVGINFDPNPPYRALPPTLPSETFYDLRIGILVGEMFYNLRCALDYLVFELAKIDSGSPQYETQFLIEDSKEGFERNLRRGRLKGLNPAHVALIETLQPYKGHEWLRRLRDRSNQDKHRELVQTGGSGAYYVHSSLEKDLSRCWGYEREAPHPVPEQPPVKVKVYISSSITFRDGAPIVETIEEIQSEVAAILDVFKPDF